MANGALGTVLASWLEVRVGRRSIGRDSKQNGYHKACDVRQHSGDHAHFSPVNE